jgi:hypothetical protein
MKINISARSARLSTGIDNGADDAVDHLFTVALISLAWDRHV